MEVDQDMAFCSGASTQPPPNARGHQFPGRPFEDARNSPHTIPRDGPWPPYDEEGRRGFLGRNKATQENFKVCGCGGGGLKDKNGKMREGEKKEERKLYNVCVCVC